VAADRPPETTRERAVVVVSYGSPDVLLGNPLLVESSPWHVVVVDNFHSQEARRAVTALAERYGWTLVALPENTGFGHGADAGARAAVEAGARTLLFANPDLAIDRAAADELAAHVESHPDDLVAPRILRPDGTTWFRGSGLDVERGRTGREHEALEPWLTGACLATAARAWTQRGGFDGRYFLYWEDVDLSWRWRRSGGRVVVRDDVTCVHDVGGTQEARGRAKSSTYYYYNCRNRLLFARLHLPARRRLRWALGALPYAREVVLRGGRRQLLRPRASVVPALRGTWSGLVALLRPGGAGRAVG